MEDGPNKFPNLSEPTLEQKARKWKIISIGLAIFSGLALGETISMAESGYYGQDEIIPQSILEGVMILGSIASNDRSNQLKQKVEQDR